METIDDWQPEVVIVGGGDFPTHDRPLSLLRRAGRVVCCDGAAVAYTDWWNSERMTLCPSPAEDEAAGYARPSNLWQIVGDGDSLPEPHRQHYADIFTHFAGQDDNDQTKATRYVAERNLRRIAYVAATGRREDHTLGNISLLMDYARQGLDVRMYTDHGVFIPATAATPATETSRTFATPVGTQVSVFAFGTKGLHADGLQYPLSDFTTWWQGTLNQAIAPQVTIAAQGDFLVYISYERKG